MRLGLIGSTGHWQTYAPALEHVAGLTLVAVAPAGPEETTGAFDHAPGLTMDTRRHDDAQKMLETERLEFIILAPKDEPTPDYAQPYFSAPSNRSATSTPPQAVLAGSAALWTLTAV